MMAKVAQWQVEASSVAMCRAESLPTRIARTAAWSCAGAALQRGVSLAAWVCCARLLGKVAFGELSIVMSTAGTLGILAGMGLGTTVTRYTAQYRDVDAPRAGRVLGLAQLIVWLSGLLVALLMIVIAPVAATRVLMAPDLTRALQISSLIVWMSAVNACQTGALAGLEAFRTLAFVNIWSGIASLPLVVLCAAFGGLEGAVWGLAASQTLNCVVNQTAMRRECARKCIRLAMAGCGRELPLLWRFALPALLSSALLLPALWSCSAWLARQPGGYAQVGLYAAADRWRLAILFVPTSIAGAVLPLLSNLLGSKSRNGFRIILQASVRISWLLALVPGVAVALLAKPLFLVFGPEYTAGWPVLAILAIAASAEAMNTALGQGVAVQSMWRRLGMDVLLVAVLGCGSWLLIPHWGALGLALASLAAYTVVVLSLQYYVRNRLSGCIADGGTLACLED